MKEGPGSSLILGPAKGSLVVRQRGVAFLLASVGRADLHLYVKWNSLRVVCS